MRISDNALNALAALECRGIGRGWVNRNLHGGETADDVVRLVMERDNSVSLAGFRQTRQNIRAEIERLGDAVDGVVGVGDDDFPVIQQTVKEGDRPIALFYRGDIGLAKSTVNKVAVIGLLNPSEKIEMDERTVVRSLVAAGKCVVSGLARGCDSVGHRETLDCGGKTVVFLSSPLNEVNPPSNRPLADEIVAKGGLLVSEYFRGARSKREFIGRYAERDRLQAMFAEAVVLAASYAQRDYGKDSGSRFALGKAAEYGVPRYVIYNAIRDRQDPMYNLSREELARGAFAIDATCVEKSHVLNRRSASCQMDLGL